MSNINKVMLNINKPNKEKVSVNKSLIIDGQDIKSKIIRLSDISNKRSHSTCNSFSKLKTVNNRSIPNLRIHISPAVRKFRYGPCRKPRSLLIIPSKLTRLDRFKLLLFRLEPAGTFNKVINFLIYLYLVIFLLCFIILHLQGLTEEFINSIKHEESLIFASTNTISDEKFVRIWYEILPTEIELDDDYYIVPEHYQPLEEHYQPLEENDDYNPFEGWPTPEEIDAIRNQQQERFNQLVELNVTLMESPGQLNFSVQYLRELEVYISNLEFNHHFYQVIQTIPNCFRWVMDYPLYYYDNAIREITVAAYDIVYLNSINEAHNFNNVTYHEPASPGSLPSYHPSSLPEYEIDDPVVRTNELEEYYSLDWFNEGYNDLSESYDIFEEDSLHLDKLFDQE